MSDMKKLICLLVLLFMFASSAFAGESLSRAQGEKLLNGVAAMIDTGPGSVTKSLPINDYSVGTNINGFKITMRDAVRRNVGTQFNSRVNKNEHYVCSFGVLLIPVSEYLALEGTLLQFSNDTSDAVIIYWDDSVVSINNLNYGTPTVYGQGYKTIIPPGQTVTTSVLMNRDRFYPYPIPRNGYVQFSYYLNVTINGKNQYVSYTAPKLFIPQETYNAVVKPKSKD